MGQQIILRLVQFMQDMINQRPSISIKMSCIFGVHIMELVQSEMCQKGWTYLKLPILCLLEWDHRLLEFWMKQKKKENEIVLKSGQEMIVQSKKFHNVYIKNKELFGN